MKKFPKETKDIIGRFIASILFGALFASRSCLFLMPIVFIAVFLTMFHGLKYVKL